MKDVNVNLLIALTIILDIFGSVKTQDSCSLCLIACGRAHGEDINLPVDLPTLKDSLASSKMNFSSLYPATSSEDATYLTDENVNVCPYTSDDATSLLRVIDEIVNTFYKKHFRKINMRNDGGIGLGVLWGQLNYIMATKGDEMQTKLKGLLKKTHSNAGLLSLQVLDQSIEKTTDPSKKFGANVMRNNSDILQGRFDGWKDFDAISKHFSEFNEIGDEKEVVYPYLDFHCLVSLVLDCSVPTVCEKIYLTDIYSQYMLMHQVIFQQFAERRECIYANPKPFENVKEFQDRLCSKAFLEASFLAERGFSRRFVDLFAEQVGFCGLMGYPNFMRADWLREILSWHKGSRSGCIPDLYGSDKTTDAIVTIKFGEFREECLVHLTSVTLMALSMNFRYMTDVCPLDIFDGYFENY